MGALQINLKSMRVVPMLMMAIFAIYISMSFNAIENSMASYLSLGVMMSAFFVSFFFLIREPKMSMFAFLMIAMMVFIGAISAMNNMLWKDWLYYTCSVILMMALFQYYSHNLSILLIGALIGFTIAVYCQLIQCVTHPEMWLVGEKTNMGYILGGNYNSIGCRIICAVATNILCLRISKWFWVNLIGLVIVSFAILFMVQSMTALTCLFLFIFICMLPSTRLQRWAIFSILIFTVLFEVFVCFQGKGFENNEFARWFLIDVLGKDVTFTLRTEKWDSSLQLIFESPIWGYGSPDADWYYSHLSAMAVGPHNFVLGVLINGGIVALVLYFAVFYYGFKQIMYVSDRCSYVILGAIASLAVMSLMEYYPLQFPFFLLALAYYYPNFIGRYDFNMDQEKVQTMKAMSSDISSSLNTSQI